MPLIRKKLDVSTAGETQFPLQGSQYEYLPFNALLEFALIQDDGGDSAIEATVYSGSDVLQEASGVDSKAAGTLNAIYPDDFVLSDVAAAGERIGVTITQRGAAPTAAEALVVVRITPL